MSGTHFFDTSALVKRYHEEPGIEAVDSIIDGDGTVVITSLSVIKAVSAFRRKQNSEDIPRTAVDGFIGAFFREALAEFVILPLHETLFDRSFELVLRDDLRTLDSLQLSAALAVDSTVDDLRFMCADIELVAVADQRGLDTTNPNPADR